MSTRAPCVRRPCWLVVALTVALGLTPRAEAKPPDLPLPVVSDFAPADDAATPPGTVAPVVEEPIIQTGVISNPALIQEGPREESVSMGDRCSAVRTLSRCVLFAMHPLSAMVRAECCCEFDEEPPFPIVRVGDGEISVRDFLRDATVVLCSGPFGPFFYGDSKRDACPPVTPPPPAAGEQESSEPPVQPSCPAGMMREKNFCPQTHACPAEMKCPVPPEAQQYMIVAQVYAQTGYLDAARECYEHVCQRYPGTCIAWEAAERLRTLSGAMKADTEKTPEAIEEAEEHNVCPSVKRRERLKAEKPVEVPDWCAAACDGCAAISRALACPSDANVELQTLNKEPARTEARIEQCLQDPINVNFKEAPLRKVLEDLRAWKNINVFVDQRALDEEGISLDRPVTIALEQVSLRSALNLMLGQANLAARVQEGVVVITTVRAARGPLVPKVYAVADLVARRKRKKGDTCKQAAMSPQELVQLIEASVAPTSWLATGGPCSIQYFPRKKALVVSQDAAAHEQIGDLLGALRRVDEEETKVADFLKELFQARPRVGEETTGGDSENSEGPPPTPQCCPQSSPIEPGCDGEEASSMPLPRSALDRSLETRINLFCRNTTLGQFLDGLSTWKGVKFVPETEALEQAGVTLDSEVTLIVNDVPLRQALKSALDQLSLKAIVKADHVVITTPAGIRPTVVAAGYDVSDLLIGYAVDWNRQTDELKVQTQEGDPHELVDLIVDGVSPGSWEAHGGRGRISYNQELKTLFIHQTAEIQEQIQEFLDAKRRELELHKNNCERQVEETGCKADGPADSRFSRSTVPGHVSRLLEECRTAMRERRLAEAEMLAARALALDPVRVRAHPLVYKMQLLDQVMATPVALQPHLPPVDSTIAQAYNEILNRVPPRPFLEVHEAGSFEESEGTRTPARAGSAKPASLLLQPEGRNLKIAGDEKEAEEVSFRPGFCFDTDRKAGSLRVRCQMQLGLTTFRYLRDRGNNSIELSLGGRCGDPALTSAESLFDTVLKSLRMFGSSEVPGPAIEWPSDF